MIEEGLKVFGCSVNIGGTKAESDVKEFGLGSGWKGGVQGSGGKANWVFSSSFELMTGRLRHQWSRAEKEKLKQR